MNEEKKTTGFSSDYGEIGCTFAIAFVLVAYFVTNAAVEIAQAGFSLLDECDCPTEVAGD